MAKPLRTCACGCGEVLPADAHHRRKYINDTHKWRVDSRRKRHPDQDHDLSVLLPPVDASELKDLRRGPQYQQFIADGWAESIFQRKVSQHAVARKTGIAQGTISRWMTTYISDRRHAALRADGTFQRDEAEFSDLAAFTERFFPELDVPGFHREWIEAIAGNADRKGKLLLLAPQRHGKALDGATEILTLQRGWVRADEVVEGDLIPGADGRWTTVVGVHPQGVTEAVEVTFSDGSSLVTNPEHVWTVRQRYYADRWHQRTSAELAGDLWEKTKNGHRNAKWRIPIVAPTEGDVLCDDALPIDPYLLGCWLGDGTTRRAEITSADPEIIDAFAAVYGEPSYEYKQGNAWTCGFTGGLLSELKRLGLIGNKHIPEDYLRATAKVRERLLQGLMDTDGTVNVSGKSTGSPSFCTTNPELYEGFCELVCSLGGVYRTHEKDPWFYDDEGNKIHGRPAWIVSIRMPAGVQVFNLQRKRELLPEPTPKTSPRRLVHDVSPVAPRETVCFTVSAEDHLFCAGRDFIVTHNSEMLIRYCLMRICQDPNISILWVSKTASLAEKMVGQVKATLEHHPELAEAALGPGLSFKPPRTSGLSWTDSEFTVAARTQVKKTPTMVAIGTGGTIVGLDADEIILDDPQDHIRCLSPTQRDKDREWFFTDFMSRKMEQTALSFIMSRQHIEDLPGMILRDHAEDWDVLTYRAHDPACIYAEQKVELHHECVLWPEYRSWKWLFGQKKADEAHFERNYMNNPKTDATTYITADDIDRIRDHTRRVGDKPSGCRLIGGIDPAEAKPVAATLWGFDGIHRHVIDAGEFSASVVGLREILSTWPSRYGMREFAFEKNMAGSWLLDAEVLRLIREQHLVIHQTYTSRVNKQSLAIGPISMFQRMRTEPPEITIPGAPGPGLERIDRLVRSWLSFDPDWAGHKHADDDLTMASWFPQLIIDTWEKPAMRNMQVDYAPFGSV